MYLSKLVSGLAVAVSFLPAFTAAIPARSHSYGKRATLIAPKMFIISMFGPEGEAWYGIDDFDVLAQNITVSGFSPLFPDAHCTADGQICQMTTGESEINAASSVSALVHSGLFNLTKTYFMIAGIAGINPEVASTGSVTFAKYAVQVALQYEFDAREKPDNFSTGYFPQNSIDPTEYPQAIYGTEVFEVSEALRDMAVQWASNATLNDSATAVSYRALYNQSAIYTAGAAGPAVHACDVATSDVYYSGALLGEAFGNTTKLFTNGSGIYCTTAQEDNATLEALLRGNLSNLTDFSRIIVMRTASDYDRPPPGVSPLDNLVYIDQGSFEPSIQNIYLAGINVINGIMSGWNSTFEAGVAPGNYIGDIFNSLGGDPDFGLASAYINTASNMTKRGLASTRSGALQYGNARMRQRAATIRRSGGPL